MSDGRPTPAEMHDAADSLERIAAQFAIALQSPVASPVLLERMRLHQESARRVARWLRDEAARAGG